MKLSIKKFCKNTYFCLHYKISKKKQKQYNLWYRDRLLMLKLYGPNKINRIMKCADTSKEGE